MKPDFVSAGSLFPSIETDEAEKERFAEKIRHDLSAEKKADGIIGKLLRTQNTFMNSLGSINDYLEDVGICNRCSKSLDKCQKIGREGYVKIPFYDEYRDEIRISLCPCRLLNDNNRILDAICPCFFPKKLIYSNSVSLIKQYKDCPEKMPYVGKALAEIIRKKKEFSDKSKASFITLNAGIERDIKTKILCYAAYLFGRTGKKVAFIDMEVFENWMMSYDDDFRKETECDFRKACLVPVLIISDFDSYLTKRLMESELNRLIFLLRSRLNVGTVTYISMSANVSLTSCLHRAMNGSKECSEIIDSVERITIPVIERNV